MCFHWAITVVTVFKEQVSKETITVLWHKTKICTCPGCESFLIFWYMSRFTGTRCAYVSHMLTQNYDWLWSFNDYWLSVIFWSQHTWSITRNVAALVTLCADVKLATDAKTIPANSVCRYHPPLPPNPHSLHPLEVPESQLQQHTRKMIFKNEKLLSDLFKCTVLADFSKITSRRFEKFKRFSRFYIWNMKNCETNLISGWIVTIKMDQTHLLCLSISWTATNISNTWLWIWTLRDLVSALSR